MPTHPTDPARTADGGLPTYSADHRSAAEIDRDLRATRSRIDRHLDELSRRSNPLNLAKSFLGTSTGRKAKDSLGSMMAGGEGEGHADDHADRDEGESTFAEVRDAVVDKARRNPIGLAMIAGGLAWTLLVEDDRAVLHRAREGYHDARDRATEAFEGDDDESVDASGRRVRRPGRRARYGSTTPRMMPSGQSTTGEYASGSSASSSGDSGPGVGDKLKSGASAAGDKASSAASAVGDAASSAAESVSDAASSIGGFLGSAASRLRSGSSRGAQRLGDASSRASGRLGDASDRGGDLLSTVADAAKANPLLAGAVALGLGALLGGLIPESKLEDDYLGEKSDELKGAAAAKASQAAEAAKQKGSELADAATERAKEAGEHLKEVATDAKEDLVQAATEELDKTSEEAKKKLDEEVPPPSKTEEAIDAGADKADEKAKQANDAANDAAKKNG